MVLTIVPLYAAVFGVVLIALSVRVIRLRRRHKVPVGSAGQPDLERAVRAQGNFSEYVPLALLLLAFLELQGGPGWLLHGLCAVLVIGRVVHAIGVSNTAEDFRYRVSGMSATFGVLGVASVLLVAGGVLGPLFG